MDKKGGFRWGLVLLMVILGAIIVFGVFSGAFSLAFKRVWDQGIKPLLGFPSEELEALKQAQFHEEDAQKRAEIDKKIAEMEKLLIDAAEFIGEGKNYDKAIQNYVDYYQNCKTYKRDASCRLVDESIKFRLLSALREKFFMAGSITTYDQLNDDIKSIINNKEFSASASLIKAAIELKKNMFGEAVTTLQGEYYINYYPKEVGEDEFNRIYYLALSRYLYIKENQGRVSKEYCSNAISNFEDVKTHVNNMLKPFETSEDPYYKDKVVFSASNYKFIFEPNSEVQSFC